MPSIVVLRANLHGSEMSEIWDEHGNHGLELLTHTCNSLILLFLHSADVHFQPLNHDAHVLEMLGSLIVLVGRVQQCLKDRGEAESFT
jgi:hypothetical protein